MTGKGLRLVALGKALPERRISNEELCSYVDTSDEWIQTRTGIQFRYQCQEESCGSLALEAARQAFVRSGLSGEEIGAIIVATSTPDYIFPSTAGMVQKGLGLPEEVLTFDLSAACTGFMMAMTVAQSLLQTLEKKYVLVIGSEQLSRIVDYADRSTCILFGDGAGAAIFTTGTGRYIQKTWSRGNEQVLSCPGPGSGNRFITMQGREVFRFAVTAMVQAMDAVLTEAGCTMADVDVVVCHQANARIIRYVQKKYPGQEDKFYINIDRYGNTSAASIPIALEELEEMGRLPVSGRILCVGFGGGLAWSAALLEGEAEDEIK